MAAAAPALETTIHVTSARQREFESLLPNVLPRFRRMAMRWLRNPEDAEDAIQDAMLSAFRHLARFDGRSQLSTWLTAIVINSVRMQIRRRPKSQMLSLDYCPKEGQWKLSDMLADPAATPEQTAEKRQLCDLVTKLAGGLSPSQRAALELRQQDDFSVRKAAKTLGVAEGTVKARLARGRAELTQRYRHAIGVGRTNHVKTKQRKSTRSAYKPRREQEMPQMPAGIFNEQAAGSWAGAQ